MKKVTLYQATSKEVNTFACGSIPIHHRSEPVQFAHNDPSPRAFLKSDVTIEHCAIERFIWRDGNDFREVYAAFDSKLLELIGCRQDQVDQMIAAAVEKQCKVTNIAIGQLNKAESELKRYDTMSLWQRVKWVFKIQ